MTRHLPPVASEIDRLAATKILADQICAELRATELARALWTERPAAWKHEIEASGAIISQRA